MVRKRLLWQLYPSYLLVATAALVATGWYAARWAERVYIAAIAQRLEAAARVVASEFPASPADSADAIRATCQRVTEATGVELSVTQPGSEQVAGAQPVQVAAALGIEATRDASSLALPVERDGRTVGVIHASIPRAEIQLALRTMQFALFSATLAIGGCVAGLCLIVSRRMSRPFEEMRDVAERFARGDLGYKLAAGDSEEMTGLAGALNQLAAQLQDRLRTIVRQTSEQQAVLASMVEGVLAIDADRRVITLNKAAAELVGNTLPQPLGRQLHEVVRNPELRRFADRALASREPIEDDVILHGDPDRVLQIRGTGLHDPQGPLGVGAVIVLSDVTHFRRLETIRRDFVANVSHELKTPITSIKGFVETLLDGALANPEDAERFLRIVATQADRLNAIIEDLLSLSKIEQSERAADLDVDDAMIHDLLDAVVRDCQAKADERHIAVRVECDEEAMARINSPLIEQAVTNLLDNAIKYSEPSEEVLISASMNPTELTIAVADHGAGVDAEHLPRLFERFYRVDKARSRKLGGTGLGLAIVKHIVHAHQGRITVDSTPGIGSTFRIHLPLSAAREPRSSVTI